MRVFVKEHVPYDPESDTSTSLRVNKHTEAVKLQPLLHTTNEEQDPCALIFPYFIESKRLLVIFTTHKLTILFTVYENNVILYYFAIG